MPEVRLEGDEPAECLAALQRAFAGSGRAPADLDAIGSLAARAKPVPLTIQVRVAKARSSITSTRCAAWSTTADEIPRQALGAPFTESTKPRTSPAGSE